MSKIEIIPPSGVYWPLGKKEAFYTLVIVILVNAIDHIDRLILTSLFPYLKDAFQLTDSQLGLLSSVTSFSIAILALFAGYFVDNWSRKKTLAIILIIWSFASGWTAVATTFLGLLIARIFIGIGEAGYNPASQSLIAASFPLKYRTTALACIGLGAMLGSSLGLLLGAIIAKNFGWHSALGIMAIPGFILALLAMFIKDFKNNSDDQNITKKTSMLGMIRSFKYRPSLVIVFFAQSSIYLFTFTLSVWMIVYMTRIAHHSLVVASSINAGFLLFSACCALCGGILNDWLRSRSIIFAIKYDIYACIVAFIIVFIAIKFVSPGSILQVVLIFMHCIFIVPLYSMNYALTADLTEYNERGTAGSLLIMTQNLLGIGLGPLLGGIFSDCFGIGNSLAIMSVFLLISGGCYIYISIRFDKDIKNIKSN